LISQYQYIYSFVGLMASWRRAIRASVAVVVLAPLASGSRTTFSDIDDSEEASVRNSGEIADSSLAKAAHNQHSVVAEAGRPKMHSSAEKEEKTQAKQRHIENVSATVSLVEEVRRDGLHLVTISRNVEITRETAVLAGVLFVGLCILIYWCCEARLRKPHHQRIVHKHKGKVIYEWDQTSNMAYIYITPPPGTKKSDLDVVIRPQELRVGRRGKAPFLKEQFFADVAEESAEWSLRDGELMVALEKQLAAEWPMVLRHQKSRERGDKNEKNERLEGSRESNCEKGGSSYGEQSGSSYSS
jgi:hypothetical protein